MEVLTKKSDEDENYYYSSTPYNITEALLECNGL